TFRRYEKPFIMCGDFKRRLADYDSSEIFRNYYSRADTDDALSRIQYVDIKTYLTDDILTKVDRASMANSLEVRCPLLDHRLMELAASIPSGLKLRGKTTKYLLKRALENDLPKDIVHRKKMGFAIPVADWFRNGIRDFAQAYLKDRRDD